MHDKILLKISFKKKGKTNIAFPFVADQILTAPLICPCGA